MAGGEDGGQFESDQDLIGTGARLVPDRNHEYAAASKAVQFCASEANCPLLEN